MKFITNLINITSKMKSLIVNQDKKILGRWNIDYCQKKINNKIDSSNEDHCGACGQYKTIPDITTEKTLNNIISKKSS